MLPHAVRRFLERRIDDVEQLEIVLLLQQHAQRSWTAADVADALRLTERAAARQLETLGRRDLLDVRLGGDVRYRFSPADAELAADARRLADAYREDRGAILAFVSARSRRALREFSDAFRISREPEDG